MCRQLGQSGRAPEILFLRRAKTCRYIHTYMSRVLTRAGGTSICVESSIEGGSVADIRLSPRISPPKSGNEDGILPDIVFEDNARIVRAGTTSWQHAISSIDAEESSTPQEQGGYTRTGIVPLSLASRRIKPNSSLAARR